MKPLFLVGVFLIAAGAHTSRAGILATPAPSSVPAMDEGGLVLLAIALVGTGLAFLRERSR
ncbi:MAG: hypothetical protein U0587_19770 [Candidatus Binatia bacterium]